MDHLIFIIARPGEFSENTCSRYERTIIKRENKAFWARKNTVLNPEIKAGFMTGGQRPSRSFQ
jgi:hypothetical protein